MKTDTLFKKMLNRTLPLTQKNVEAAFGQWIELHRFNSAFVNHGFGWLPNDKQFERLPGMIEDWLILALQDNLKQQGKRIPPVAKLRARFHRERNRILKSLDRSES